VELRPQRQAQRGGGGRWPDGGMEHGVWSSEVLAPPGGKDSQVLNASLATGRGGELKQFPETPEAALVSGVCWLLAAGSWHWCV
jgi:hypothetical protein